MSDSTMFSANGQKGFAPIVIIVLLVGITTGVFLVQEKTNLFSKAFDGITGSKSSENLHVIPPSVSSSSANISTRSIRSTPKPLSAFERIVLRMTGNSSNTSVSKTTPTPTPSPTPALQTTPTPAPTPSPTLSPTEAPASSTTAPAATATPEPTPSPTPLPITVDTTSVVVTLKRSDAQGGLIYGSGFTVTSNSAIAWSLRLNQSTQGEGFYDASGGISPGSSFNIRSYINPNKTNGVYTGSETLLYRLSNSNNDIEGPTINYTITLTD